MNFGGNEKLRKQGTSKPKNFETKELRNPATLANARSDFLLRHLERSVRARSRGNESSKDRSELGLTFTLASFLSVPPPALLQA